MGTSTQTVQRNLGAPSSSSLWRPLRVSSFRNLLIANVVSDIGTFMQGVGAAWLMVSLGAGPMYVALTQTAAALPYFLLALPAGSAGDIVDRRKIILFSESWMVGIALILAFLTITKFMSPWILLALTFALSAGDAFETPAWLASLPELVLKEDMAAASALNGIEFNLARAVGPALAGALISAAGIAAAFVANVISFFGVLVVVARLKRRVQNRTGLPETLSGATAAAIRYVGHSPAILKILLRTGAAMFFSSALFALLPTLSRSVNRTAGGYGFLLASFGAGAIIGALIMQSAGSRWSTESLVSAGIVGLGLVITAMGFSHHLGSLAALLAIGGATWIIIISLINALVQGLAPSWVRARVLAIYFLVYQGSYALGAAAWGVVAQRSGIHAALVYAGFGTAATAALACFAPLPKSTRDLSPWNHWRMPVVIEAVGGHVERGPVLITIEYAVIPGRTTEFVQAMHESGRMQRRNGAYRWEIFGDAEEVDRYLEIFLVNSWAEHLRQHERQTVAGRELEARIRTFLSAEPIVRHLIDAEIPKA